MLRLTSSPLVFLPFYLLVQEYLGINQFIVKEKLDKNFSDNGTKENELYN